MLKQYPTHKSVSSVVLDLKILMRKPEPVSFMLPFLKNMTLANYLDIKGKRSQLPNIFGPIKFIGILL